MYQTTYYGKGCFRCVSVHIFVQPHDVDDVEIVEADGQGQATQQTECVYHVHNDVCMSPPHNIILYMHAQQQDNYTYYFICINMHDLGLENSACPSLCMNTLV